MKLIKDKFLKTEFGAELEVTIRALDFHIAEKEKTKEWKEPERYRELRKIIDILFAQWNVYKMALRQFYGMEYSFTRTDEYYGVCSKNGEDWLIQVLRKKEDCA